MTKLIWAARILFVASVLVGWESMYQTFNHVGDPRFLISTEHPGGVHHAWYHALREFFANVGTTIALLLIFFAPTKWLNPIVWWASLALMAGFYAPFWAGIPFIPDLSAPTFSADLRHLLQTIFALGALLIAWPIFMKKT